MNEHLVKAKAALEAAKGQEAGSDHQMDLLSIATTQAMVAHAELMEELVLALKQQP